MGGILMIKQRKENVIENQSEDFINRKAELDELNFSDDEPSSTFMDWIPESEYELEENSERLKHTKRAKTAMPGDEPNDDDLAPETLIKEDGARSSRERGSGKAMDQRLSIVDEDEIGGGNGLDEAELARVHPLDGKPE